MEETGRIIGLDVGDVRTGVAISDPLGMFASPHSTIAMASAEENLAAVRRVVEETGAVTIVAGIPLDREGKPGPQAEKILAFVDTLRGALAVPVETIDERFTTAGADRALRAMGASGKKRRTVVDKVAAAQILQTYLDRQAARRRMNP